MDILKKSWIEVEVHSQLKNLIAARRNLYSDAKSKKPGNSGSLEALITREDSIGLAGELQISPKMVNWPPLQVKKVLLTTNSSNIPTDVLFTDFEQWIYYTPTEPPPGSGQQPRFITGELSDTASTIICEFTPSCVSSFEKTEGRRITERSIGNIVQLLEFDLVFQGSDGLLFWENYDYQDQCDSSKAVKKRGKSSKPLPTRHKNPQVPVPEPRFRVYKFKVLSSDESQIFGNPQARRPKHLITTLPRKSLVDKGLRESSAKREVKEMTKPHISAESDTDDELNFESQHTSPAKWGQKHRESFEDGDISQMAFATQIGQFSPPRAGSCHNSASPNPASSRSSEMPDADRSEDWKRRMDDCATDLKRTIQALRHLPMVKGTKSAPKVTGGNTGKIPGDEQLGRSSTGIAPPFEGSAGQSSYSGPASREGTSDVSPGSEKSARKLGRPKKPIELLPLNTTLHLHPGWQGMKEVTRMDVTIPKGQLMVLETDVAWYPRKEHLAHRNTPSTHDNVAIQSPCNRGSPQGESSAVLPSLPNYSDSDSELSWSPSPVAQNAMPPDSSAIQPSETPVPRRLKDSCRRCKDYELICSSLHFQTESRCESCHNAGESCEYGHAAEGVSRRKRRKTHQKVTDDATEDEEEGESHPTPTWKKTRREVATSGTDFSYADPELDEFSFIANQTVKGSILLQRESTIEKPASDMVQGARINKKPQDNSTCSISSTNKPSTQRLESSYEDPEFGDFSVIIKKPANKVSTASQKDGGLKKRGFEGKLSIASSCELDVFLSTKKSKAKSANCTRKNANRKESARELPSKSVPKQLKDSVVTSAGSDTDGETQLMLNPHGTTNVAKFGLLRSQALVYKKEEERKKQERLSLGLPEEEEEGVTDFRISEPEPYDGYSSSEDKEQRQRKARSITANCSSDHSGPNDGKHSPLSPALDLDGINLPSYQSSDVSSHASSGRKDPFVVAPDTIHLGLASPTHPRDAFRQNDSEVDSLEDPPQAVPASNRVKSSTSNAMSQLVVRESPRKLTAQEPIVLEDHHEDEDEEDDEIPQAIPTAYVAPRTSHIAVVQVHAIESDKRGKLQELEPVSDVASPNGDARKPSASIALTSRDQIPLPAHEKKDWDTPSRDVSQPGRAKFSLSPGDKPAIQEVLFPSTAPQRQCATIQVKDTPYPLAKSISYKKLTAAGAFKTLGSDEIPAVPCLEGDEIIPCTASSSQPFDAVIPVQQGIKRKNGVENSTAESKKGWKRPRVRKLEFGSQEAGFKDLSDLAKEHKKRYLESVGSSIKSVEELDGHKNERMQVPDGQRIAAEKGPVVAPLPPPPTKSLLSVNTAIPSPTLMQPPILKLKVSPVSVAQMSLSSRRSSTSTRRRKQSHPKSESSTQKALKAIIAAKRASLSGNSPGPISPSNALFTSVSPASRSSTVSRTSHKVMKPVSSRNTYSVPSLAFATHSGCLPDQHNPSPKTHPPTKAAQHALKVLNSDDTASDTEDVISARPPPPRTQEVQTTLIPSMAAPPLPEKPERIGNYASIEGRDINVLIPGYNRLSAEKKSRLNERRKAYFGPGELVMQSSELVTAEEESRQRRIQEFRDRFKEEVPKKKLWWQEDDTPVRSYGRKLGAVKSVKQGLERRDEGVTRVEVERLSRGGMLKNLMRML
ncbi:hypothetical protein L211DRAFT_846236 [Terfezia boudieri ATCC MYA-4762]|uniref:Shelterin complex subunit TPP1/Est3 domain-containing protein n=1 Tax=Terfezia boudieri ATCC MYA-4762 TaxID=1051890 RepID=A0A3N4M0J5_9PEZI|nr:hypothetical protein L211DRAFT_846236 [Terfezia boudieri ATCC MYA-4762]